jgi:hypothetical protein
VQQLALGSVSESVASVYKRELRRIAFAERPGRVHKSAIRGEHKGRAAPRDISLTEWSWWMELLCRNVMCGRYA